LCNTVQHNATPCNTVQHNAAQCPECGTCRAEARVVGAPLHGPYSGRIIGVFAGKGGSVGVIRLHAHRFDSLSVVFTDECYHRSCWELRVGGAGGDGTVRARETHCNTLQHTATHCSTLQHSARRTNACAPLLATAIYVNAHDASTNTCNYTHKYSCFHPGTPTLTLANLLSIKTHGGRPKADRQTKTKETVID